MPEQNYAVFTDSACDISPELLAKWGVHFEPLTFRFTDSENEYPDGYLPSSEFYAAMRAGKCAKTAAVTPEAFTKSFRQVLESGKDVLYLGFSSGISNSYNAGRIAAKSLEPLFPERKIITVDTLSASAGEGLLVYLTMQKVQEGATIEEAAAYATETRLHLCHWFTVDDLVYLKRGGRISPTLAFVGSVLGIKPVMHVDNEGKLVNVSKARGRHNAIAALAAHYRDSAVRPATGHIFISHGDCLADAEELARLIREQTGAEVELITPCGPVIGSHSGPGTLALFFVGAER